MVDDKNTAEINFNWRACSTSEMNIIDSALSKQENKKAYLIKISEAIDDIETSWIVNRPNNDRLKYRKIDSCSKIDISNSQAAPRLYLTMELSGYGSLKTEWKYVLIGTGAVEAVAQGVLVAAATQNPWWGVAMAAEEMTSEYLTWNGVDWILGETYAPVTLEGHLLYRGRIIWRDSYFVTENEDDLAKNERKDKTKQLRASLHLAEKKMFDDITLYIDREILHPQWSHASSLDDSDF